MSDKLISLEAVVDLIDRSNADLIIKSERYELIEDIEALPPAELPMSAVELLRALPRMYNLFPLLCVEYERWLDLEEIEKAVTIVEEWAREHPEEAELRGQ